MPSPIRMTTRRAAEMFLTATPITAARLTEQHLDMLQMVEDDLRLRVELGNADDALRAGDREAAVVRRCVAAYNARCGW